MCERGNFVIFFLNGEKVFFEEEKAVVLILALLYCFFTKGQIVVCRYVKKTGNTGVALCGWAAKADDSFVCFGAKPDKGFLDMKSRRIRKWEGDANESWRGKGAERQLTGDPDESSWRWTAERQLATGPGREQLGLDSRGLAWNHGQGQSTRDSGDSRRQDRVQ